MSCEVASEDPGCIDTASEGDADADSPPDAEPGSTPDAEPESPNAGGDGLGEEGASPDDAQPSPGEETPQPAESSDPDGAPAAPDETEAPSDETEDGDVPADGPARITKPESVTAAEPEAPQEARAEAAPMALAAATGCNFATSGPQAPAICWLDFSGFNAAQALSAAGQHFHLSLPGGYSADFNVNTSGGNAAGINAAVQGANSGVWATYYPGVAGRPILQRSSTGTTNIRISSFVVTDAAGATVPNFGMVAGDGESTAASERLTVSTTGTPWQLVGRTGNGCAANIIGLGTSTVTCYGNVPQTPGAYGTAVFSTTNPTAYTVGLVDPGSLGVQAAVFGFQTATLTLNKVVNGRVEATDSFDTSVTSTQGTVLGSATTGAASTSTTGPITLLPGAQAFTMREVATSGSTSLDEYLQSWSCTNQNTASTTVLPSGAGVSKSIVLGIGDVVTCTITNTPGTPDLRVVKTFTGNADEDGSGTVSLGDTLSYTVTATNSGNVRMTDVVVSDDLTGDSRECAIVAIGATCVLTTSYVVTQTDVDAGGVVNTGSAVADRVTEPVTDVETVPVAQSPAQTLVKELTANADEDGSGTVSVGDTLTYTLTATNTGDVTLVDVVVSDDLTGQSTTCASVPLGGACVLTAMHSVTQAEADAGEVVNTGAAVAQQLPDPVTDAVTVEVPQNPALSMVKSATPLDAESFVVGAEITYSFVVTNTGDVTITTPTVVEGTFTGAGELSPLACTAVASLAPHAQMVCTATYTVLQADIDEGFIENTASATGTAPDGEVVESAETSFELPADQAPGVAIDKFASPGPFLAVGQVVTYSFRVTNTGNVTISDVAVADDTASFTGSGTLSPIDCPSGSLIPGANTTCTATYPLTQEDVDRGSISNTASASAEAPSGGIESSPDTETIAIIQSPALTLVKSVSPTDPDAAGQAVTYSFLISNTGNVTLTDIGVAELAFSGSGPAPVVSCPTGEMAVLAPGDDLTCTAVYELTQADVDAGTVTNSAAASGLPPSGGPVASVPAAVDLPILPQPSLTIEKSATPKTVTRAGETVTYSFVVTNTGNVTLSEISVNERSFSGTGAAPVVGCPGAPLAPGQATTCTGTYPPTQTDVDRGLPLVNTAIAEGITPSGAPTVSGESNAAVVDIEAEASLALEIAVDNPVVTGAGQRVEYTFTVTNTGAVTMRDIAITDVTFTGSGPTPTIVCPSGPLSAGESMVCTAVYVTTAADVVTGRLDLAATATGATPSGESTVAPQADVEVLVDEPTEPTPPGEGPGEGPGGGDGGGSGDGGALPATGADAGIPVLFGTSALLLGLALLTFARRRPSQGR